MIFRQSPYSSRPAEAQLVSAGTPATRGAEASGEKKFLGLNQLEPEGETVGLRPRKFFSPSYPACRKNMKHATLYHWTDKLSAAAITDQRIIRASPMTLHEDMLAQDAGVQTAPLVWLTLNPNPEPTVAIKLCVEGWSPDDLSRVEVGDGAAFLTIEQYIAASGISARHFHWMLATARMAGSNPDDWRVSTTDVPL